VRQFVGVVYFLGKLNIEEIQDSLLASRVFLSRLTQGNNKGIRMTKKLRLFKGGRKRDICDVCEKRSRIDINGELIGEDSPDPTFEGFTYHYGDDGEELRRKASGMVRQITNDPLEHDIADLMLDYGYTEEEVAEIQNISLARVEWFMRKIEGWKRKR